MYEQHWQLGANDVPPRADQERPRARTSAEVGRGEGYANEDEDDRDGDDGPIAEQLIFSKGPR